MVYEARGDPTGEEVQLREVVALDEALGHPDLERNRATSIRIQQLRGQSSGVSPRRPFWRRLFGKS
jgi:hypothetical protein